MPSIWTELRQVSGGWWLFLDNKRQVDDECYARANVPQVSSVQDGIIILRPGKPRLRSTPSLRCIPNVAFEAVLQAMQSKVSLTHCLQYAPFKVGRRF